MSLIIHMRFWVLVNMLKLFLSIFLRSNFWSESSSAYLYMGHDAMGYVNNKNADQPNAQAVQHLCYSHIG